MEHKQNPTTGKLRKAINYQQMKIQQEISWVGQSTRYFLKGGEKFQPLGSKTLLTRQKGETVCTKEGESSCAATYALSCEFRSNTFEPFEQQIFCGATFYEGHLLLQMFNRLLYYTYYGEHIMNILWTYYEHIMVNVKICSAQKPNIGYIIHLQQTPTVDQKQQWV